MMMMISQSPLEKKCHGSTVWELHCVRAFAIKLSLNKMSDNPINGEFWGESIINYGTQWWFKSKLSKLVIFTNSNPNSVDTPDIWLRYVDNTFTVLEKCEVSKFTKHINNIDSNIKFTMEEPENNALAVWTLRQQRRKMDKKISRCIENLHTPINI